MSLSLIRNKPKHIINIVKYIIRYIVRALFLPILYLCHSCRIFASCLILASSYDFRVSISVDHPYFDEISYSLSNGPVNVGDRPPRTASGAWKMRGSIFNGFGANDYYTYCEMGEEIQELFNSMQLGDQESEQAGARMAVICPRCGATTIPDTHGCCEYCGGAVN